MPKIIEEFLDSKLLRWTIDNPSKKNAITPDMLQWLVQRCEQLNGEQVILRGSGTQVFSSGFDLDVLANESERTIPRDENLIAATSAMRYANATFIATVRGLAIGAAVEILCTCDFRIVAHGARISVPAGQLGVVYHSEGLGRMLAILGMVAISKLMLVGETLCVETPCLSSAWHAVVATDALDNTGVDLAKSLAKQAPLSLAANRLYLRRLADRHAQTMPNLFATEHEQHRKMAFLSHDHQEALEAIAQRRAPRFQGR